MSGKYLEPILLVDDDVNLLAGLRRTLGRKFDVKTAESGAEALSFFAAGEIFALVISDMRMPEMDGIQLLARIAELNADTVRIMLTGNADLKTAMNAVNESQIFRFLTKPCDREILIRTVEAGIKQYRLITSERELLEKTLGGSMQVFSEILAMVNPMAFSRSVRLKKHCQQITSRMGREDSWQFEMAALLSQIGCISLPVDTLAKIDAGQVLNPQEQEMFDKHPAVGESLLSKIPRLDSVSAAIGNQQRSFREFRDEGKQAARDDGDYGAMLLKAVIDFDDLLVGGLNRDSAIAAMRAKGDLYAPGILVAMGHLDVEEGFEDAQNVAIHGLNSTMVLAEDLRTKNGLLLATKGQGINSSIQSRLENYASRDELPRTIRVRMRRIVSTVEA
jgi:CheY-like chemotaxis protein